MSLATVENFKFADLLQLAVSAAVAVIGLMIRSQIKDARISSLEDERKLKDWVIANFVSKDACEEHRRAPR